MSNNRYSNFVRPSSPARAIQPTLTGEDAKRIYLDEIKLATTKSHTGKQAKSEYKTQKTVKNHLESFSKKDLFISAQTNDVQTLKQILDVCPNMLNAIDDYGWSLLMIACQANSVDSVKELMKRGIDTSIRDKAGNSAQSLVIKNRNLILADVLLSYRSNEPKVHKNSNDIVGKTIIISKESYFCKICDKDFPDKEEHLSSTVHNIDASRGKKVPTSFAIPLTNKGYQIMLKVGWDKESGLGPDGSGKKYPIRIVQKQDRKGLGLDKRKKKTQGENKEVCARHVNRKLLDRECTSSKRMEINFRRQFY